MRQVPKRKLCIEACDHEELFLRYYQRLFGWAFRLTGGPRARAEDLLHDAFIQFVLCRPDLSNINDIDSYLYRLLLNLFLAQKRKAAQMQDLSLNITNYDSAELGLNAIDFQARWQAREDLLRICHYACVRKETSRAGSVLILRFFYDYSPSEIARMTLSPRRAVDDWLRIARREARFYLEDPGRLKFMAGGQEQFYRFKTRLTESSDDIVSDLQASILSSCQGSCLSKTQLRAIYQDSEKGRDDKTAGCKMLAHIVSCASCLDQVNQLLGLPPLSARHLTGKENSDPDESDDDSDKDDTDGAGKGIGPSKAFIDRCRGQLRQVMEHRPEELRFSANGSPIGALKINSELSELQLSIHDQSPVDFIEVFSERGVRLILFSLEHGEDAPVEQRAQIELSEGRTLELIFKLWGSWPSLRVIYHDPLLQEAWLAPNDALTGALTLVCNDGSSPDNEEPGSAHWFTRLWRRLNSKKAALSVISEPDATQGTFKAEPTTRTATAPEDKDSRYEEPRVFELGRAQDLIRGPLWARTGPITALFSVMLIGALLYLWMPGAKPVTAASLLERARNAEEKLDRDPDLVQHRILDLEERMPNGGSNAGKVIARRQIQIWRNGATRLRVRRLYDERRQLTVGEWSRADGSRTIYRRGIRPQTIINNNRPFTLEDLWQIEPSAQNFITLVGRIEAATVAEQPDIYLLNYEDSTPRPAQLLGSDSQGTQVRVLRTTLTLRKSDLRAIDQIMLVEVEGDNPQLREFHFHESGFEGHPAEKVQPKTFEPEPELLGPIAHHNAPARIEEAASQPLTSTPATGSALGAAELAAIEVEVLHLLDQIGANLGEQVNVARMPDKTLNVEALVDTNERKEEIRRALQPVSANPAVKLKVQTFSEALAQQQATPPRRIGVGEIEILGSQIPVYDDLRRYFGALGRASEGDAAIRRFADRILDLSSQAMSHIWALQLLAQKFPTQELAALTPEARAKWLTMIGSHARHFEKATKILRSDLEPVFFATAPRNSAASGANDKVEADLKGADDASLIIVINRLFELATVQDQEIRSAFTLSNESGSSLGVKAPLFRYRLRRAEALADYIGEASRQSAEAAKLKTLQ